MGRKLGGSKLDFRGLEMRMMIASIHGVEKWETRRADLNILHRLLF